MTFKDIPSILTALVKAFVCSEVESLVEEEKVVVNTCNEVRDDAVCGAALKINSKS